MKRSIQDEEALFEAARQLKAAEVRGAFLAQACAGDAALRARLEALLAAEAGADHFLQSAARSAASLVVEAEPGSLSAAVAVDDQVGKAIGPYKILQRIGEGGCGVVYRAEQLEPVRREVARKVIRLGMDTESVIAG